MPLQTRKHWLVLLSVVIVAPTSVLVALWSGLYVLIGLHLGEQPFFALTCALVVACGALLAYWVLLLDLCSADSGPLPDRSHLWTLMLGAGVTLALLLLVCGLLAANGLLAATGMVTVSAQLHLASWLLLTGPPVLLPTAWLLQLRAEQARSHA